MKQRPNFIDTKNLDWDQITKIYDVGHPGYIHIRDIICENNRKSLLEEIDSKLDFRFKKAPSNEGKAWQEFLTVQLGRSDDLNKVTSFKYVPDLQEGRLPLLEGFIRDYTQTIHNPLARLAGFNQEPDLVNSIGIHKYPVREGGLGYHRDYASNINLIATVTLKGSSNLFYAENIDGKNEFPILLNGGDLFLIRGPRNEAENSIRPYHKVESVGQERYAILFRTLKEAKKNA